MEHGETPSDAERPSKRARRSGAPELQEAEQQQPGQAESLSADSRQLERQGQSAHGALQIEHILYIRWFGTEPGQTKLNKLMLQPWSGDLDTLQELPKDLIAAHYPERQRLPDYFTNAAYLRFTPAVECLALPGDVVRTELRLALAFGGWEYTILKKEVSSHSSGSSSSSADQTIHVMTAEFMGSDPLMAALGVRISLISYPVVALKRVFLEDAHERLLSSPDTFKGML